MSGFKLLSKEEQDKVSDSISTHVKIVGKPATLLKKAAAEKNLGTADTVEQMVNHCLRELYGPDALK